MDRRRPHALDARPNMGHRAGPGRVALRDGARPAGPLQRRPGGPHADGVKCAATNSCKGQSACKTASASCKGQNACKGQGYSEVPTSADCTAKGGKVL